MIFNPKSGIYYALPLVCLFLACSYFFLRKETPSFDAAIPLSLDQEERLTENKVLTSGTQSLNRYHSVLRDFSSVHFNYSATKKRIDLSLNSSKGQLSLSNIDARFLVPLLPYAHDPLLDDFDKANLLLAEFARDGVSLSYQEKNTAFGYFNSSSDLFNGEGEFQFLNGQISPNEKVRPKRFSLTNNCLHPGLWEMNASDAVGEIYHAWFTLSPEAYFGMIKDNNSIENTVEELAGFIENNETFQQIPLQLDRLRTHQKVLFKAEVFPATDKSIGAYSSQDSRRKVQRGFYKTYRGDQEFQAQDFSELQDGDFFSLHSFKPPGVYTAQAKTKIPYQSNWDKAIFSQVMPKTDYGGDHKQYGKYGFLEVELFSSDAKQSIIAGNIPIQLLVLSDDYSIPGFGVGVLPASEPIERRYLRLKEGPYPHYAYLVENQGDQKTLVNNHQQGYEQIYFRPFQKDDQLFLRMTVVSYERIVDLMEFEIPLEGALVDLINRASLEYQPPIFEVYQDSNVL